MRSQNPAVALLTDQINHVHAAVSPDVITAFSPLVTTATGVSVITPCNQKAPGYDSRTIADSGRRSMLFSSGDSLTGSSISSGEGLDEQIRGESP
jgi:hypothetical protein